MFSKVLHLRFCSCALPSLSLYAIVRVKEISVCNQHTLDDLTCQLPLPLQYICRFVFVIPEVLVVSHTHSKEALPNFDLSSHLLNHFLGIMSFKFGCKAHYTFHHRFREDMQHLVPNTEGPKLLQEEKSDLSFLVDTPRIAFPAQSRRTTSYW